MCIYPDINLFRGYQETFQEEERGGAVNASRGGVTDASQRVKRGPGRRRRRSLIGAVGHV